MTPGGELRAVGDEVVQRVATAPQVFCFLDHDGTLVPLAERPSDATPLRGIAAVLDWLATAPGMRVAVVTGCTVADVRCLLDVSGIYYIGVHGGEVLLPSGRLVLAPGIESMQAILPELRRRLHEALDGWSGLQLEDKGTALAIHYRRATPAAAAAACRLVERVVRVYQERGASIRLAYGREVAEIRHANVTKGTAICALLAAQQPAALPVYIGDDRTDEDAFAMLPPHAVTIRVGGAVAPTLARYHVANPQAVFEFLRAVRAWRARQLHASPHHPRCGLRPA